MLLVIFRPGFTVGLGVSLRGRRDEFGSKSFLEFVVGDVVPVVIADHGRLEMFSEPVDKKREKSGRDCSRHPVEYELTHLMMGDLAYTHTTDEVRGEKGSEGRK